MKGISTIKTHSFNMLLRGGRITKWKGRVASLSPHFGALAAGVSLTAFATALLLFPTDAQAGTCVAGATPGTFVCSGPAAAGDVTQNISDAPGATVPLTITTAPGFGITTAVGDALSIRGNGTAGTSFTDNNASAITGNRDGIYANNYGPGALRVTSNGTVTGVNRYGIYAFNGFAGTYVTIDVNNTLGDASGIYALNLGKGALSITSTGTATGTSGDGIYANNSDAATSLNVVANNSLGDDGDGIYALNFGNGALSITSTGTASGNGAGQGGIDAYNSAAGTSLTISAKDAMGDGDGIGAVNLGKGALSVTSTGTVTGDSFTGIYAYNSVDSTDVTIAAANVMGYRAGIVGNNYGTGALSITSTGDVIATATMGMSEVYRYAGIYAFSSGAGTSLTVSANNVTGGDFGIFAKNGTVFDRGYGGLTISAATTSGGYTGIYARTYSAGPLSVRSTETARGTAGIGILAIVDQLGSSLTVSANNAMGGINGIETFNGGNGPLSVTVSGTVTGGTGVGIVTNSRPGSAVAINLMSTATVGTSAGGSGVAILDGLGNATVTIAGGAKVNGSVLLGDGSDTLNIASGAILTGVTRLSGEAPVAPLAGVAGDIDTLNIGADFAGDLNDFEVINLDIGSSSFTLGSVISNVTSLTKKSAGTATLSGVSNFTAPTMVTGGTLNVTGMIASSPVTVQTGGTLGGTGTVGTVMAQSGATVSPGTAAGATGTLTVNGGLTLAAGSTLAIDVAPMSQDLVSVTGAATLGGALVITPSAAMGFGQSITILSAGSVTGTFASTMTAGPFGAAFTPMVVINGATVMLQLAPASMVILGGPGLRPNALAFATAFDAAVTGGFNPQAFMGLFTQGANLPAALNQFTGEIHSAERRVALEDTRIVREAVFDRLSGGGGGARSVSTEDGETVRTLWMQGVASTGKAQADSVGSRFTSDRTGFLFGGDIATASGFRFGALFSSINSDVDLARLDKSKVRSVGGAIYAGYRQAGSGFAVGGGGAVADNRFKSRRSITVPGLVQSLSSRSGGTTYQIFGEISYDLASAEDTRIEPFVRAAYAKLDAGALTEAGGVAAVKAAKQGNDLTTTTVGVRGAVALGKATLSGSAGYQHASGDRSAPTDLSVVGVTNPFRIRSVALDRNAAALEAQAGFRLTPGIAFGVGYSGVIGSNNTDHGGRATLTFAL